MVFFSQIFFKYYENLGIYYILYYLDIQKKLLSIQPLFLNTGTQLLFVARSTIYWLSMVGCSYNENSLHCLLTILHLCHWWFGSSDSCQGLRRVFAKLSLNDVFSFSFIEYCLHGLCLFLNMVISENIDRQTKKQYRHGVKYCWQCWGTIFVVCAQFKFKVDIQKKEIWVFLVKELQKVHKK